MTPQERSLLENFLAQLVQVRGVNKDPEAERLIARAVEQQPDATYLVVQRALLLGQALEQAKVRIAELEEAGRGHGFLDPNASGWGNSAGPSSGGGGRGQGVQQAGNAPAYGAGGSSGAPAYGGGTGGGPAAGGAPGYGAPVYGAPAYGGPAYGAAPVYPAYGAPPVGGGFSSFLGQAAATAAGVAGGEFLFQGIENLFGHHGGGFAGGGFGGGGFGGGGLEAVPTEEVTINNYYAPEELNVENDFNRSPPDEDSDQTFTSDDLSGDDLSDDQDFV